MKKNSFTPIKPLNPKQAKLIQSIYTKELVISTGFAGTGKSYLTAALAAQFYHEQKVDRIVLTRPTVPIEKSLGFMPGNAFEKLQPWMAPFISVLEQFLSKGEVECMLKNEKLQLIPFETLRGYTFNQSFVILDEAQNSSISEMKCMLTRLGKNSTTVINGDPTQTDLKKANGLDYLCDLYLKHKPLQAKVDWVQFDKSEIVRSDLCRLFIEAME